MIKEDELRVTKKVIQEQAKWKRQFFLLKTVYCEGYQEETLAT